MHLSNKRTALHESALGRLFSRPDKCPLWRGETDIPFAICIGECPLMTQGAHHCRGGLRNQVQSNDKNRQTYHNKKNQGSDAVVPIERPGDEVSQRCRCEQKQNEYAKNRKRHRFSPSVALAGFFVPDAETNNIANSQRFVATQYRCKVMQL